MSSFFIMILHSVTDAFLVRFWATDTECFANSRFWLFITFELVKEGGLKIFVGGKERGTLPVPFSGVVK